MKSHKYSLSSAHLYHTHYAESRQNVPLTEDTEGVMRSDVIAVDMDTDMDAEEAVCVVHSYRPRVQLR